MGRVPYESMSAGAAYGGNRGGDRNGDRFGARRRSFQNWYVNTYPAWLGYGYPYLIDPGFYDWDDSDDSADNQSGAPADYPAGDYPAPYPEYGYGPPGEMPPETAQVEQPAAAAVSAPVDEQPLTVIFKGGRAPVKMQNYMMTAKVLTDLDPRHYERIPLDEINIAATQRVNSAAGVEFDVPGTSRD